MRRLVKTLGIVLALACLTSAAFRPYSQIGSYAFGKRYVVTISRPAIDDSPTWADDAENPPVSAKKALKLATVMKDSLVKDSDDFKWKLESLSLEPYRDGKWYWLANYEAEFQGFSTGVPNNLRLVVLMDGTVIEPEVTEPGR